MTSEKLLHYLQLAKNMAEEIKDSDVEEAISDMMWQIDEKYALQISKEE